jgi:hypothetical protein
MLRAIRNLLNYRYLRFDSALFFRRLLKIRRAVVTERLGLIGAIRSRLEKVRGTSQRQLTLSEPLFVVLIT